MNEFKRLPDTGEFGSKLASRLDTYVNRRIGIIVTAALGLYLGRALLISQQKPLFRDELYTWAQVQGPDLTKMWAGLMHAPIVVDPPLYPTRAFFFARLPLPVELALRLPSILAYGAMMLSLFVIARRRASNLIALIAFTIPMIITPLFDYAIDARPYALLLAFSGWAFAFWQKDRIRQTQPASLTLLAICLTGAMLTHYFAVFVLIPFCAGELWRSARYGADMRTCGALLAPIIAVLVYIPFLPAAARYRANPWRAVSYTDLDRTYALISTPEVLIALLSCCAAALLLCSFKRETRPQPANVSFHSYEIAALLGFLVIPVTIFVAAKLVTRSYVPRYGIAFVIGAILLLTAIFEIIISRAKGLAHGALALLLFYAILPFSALTHRLPVSPDSIDNSWAEILCRFPGAVIGVDDPGLYLRFRLFGRGDISNRMVLISEDKGTGETPSTNDLSNQAIHELLGVPNERVGQFVDAHQRFLLIGNGFRNKLIATGERLLWQGEISDNDLYLVENRQM